MFTLPTGNPTWPDHVYTAFATAITSNRTPSLTYLVTDKDLAPFVPDVPQAVRDLNANDKFLIAFTNQPLLKYIREAAASGVTRPPGQSCTWWAWTVWARPRWCRPW